ncbi:putative gustatory receptor 93c [Teleopsis dalmanni]|uniref:putative gustatory receptor 93c n=1 Tax=Teleopsis dalmanni TaxID=139649 RepID=UPI0018CF8E4F|nr:putative gustatory receptor 93c [Teleopsis dalmanni]
MNGSIMILHICFLGYICIGSLYSNMNNFMRNDFCCRLEQLDNDMKRCTSSHTKYYKKRLRDISKELSDCSMIFERIYKACQNFHRLIELPVCYTFLFSFATSATSLFFTFWQYRLTNVFLWGCPVSCLKVCTDILLMTLAAYSAVNNGEMIKNVNLYTVNISDRYVKWHHNVS